MIGSGGGKGDDEVGVVGEWPGKGHTGGPELECQFPLMLRNLDVEAGFKPPPGSGLQTGSQVGC